jgi:hypothetical protein
MFSNPTHRRQYALLAALALALGTGTAALANDTGTVAKNSDNQTVTVENAKGWRLDQLFPDGSGSQHAYVEIVLEVATDTDLITIGVLPDGPTTADSVLAEAAAAMVDLMEPGDADQTESPAVAKAHQDTATEARDALTQIQLGNVNVMRATLTKSSSVPQDLKNYVVNTERSAADASPEKSGPAVPNAAAAAGTCGNIWRPSFMTMKVKASSVSGTHYAQLEFAWNSVTRLQNLQACPAVAFEPDFVTYNYDNLHYMTKTIKSWSTDMSEGYLDTPFSDSDDERVYTVGTLDAQFLNQYESYYTYIRATNGNSSTDTAKMVAQRAKRNVPFCGGSWCVFAQASERYPSPSGWVNIPVSSYTVTR